MIELHTLGDAMIKVGDREIRPSSPMVFAALLYLCVERGRRVPRAALQELLFPESDERSGAHSLRQLLYKLRQLGTSIETDHVAVWIRGEIRDSAEVVAVDNLNLGTIEAGFLPGYTASSSAYAEWLDRFREKAVCGLLQKLRHLLTEARDRADRTAIDRISLAVLELDPLDDAATHARAQTLALDGNRIAALRLLERYSTDVAALSPELGASTERLRRRVAERIPVTIDVPLLGREGEFAALLSEHRRATEETSTVSLIWGDPGIGKTRLVSEFETHRRLTDSRLAKAECQPHDVNRPFSALSDLVPQLLRMRGALGASPATLAWLNRFQMQVDDQQASGDKESSAYITSQLRRALRDLLSSVASDAPLTIVVEDAHWLDDASARFLYTATGGLGRLHVIVTRRGSEQRLGPAVSADVFTHALTSLNAEASSRLLSHALGDVGGIDQRVTDECLRLCSGNPLFIRSVAEHVRVHRAVPHAESRVSELLLQRVRGLDAKALLMLRSIAVLGHLGTMKRVAACCGGGFDMLSFQDLVERGLVVLRDETLRSSHDLLTNAVLSDTPAPIITVLNGLAADVLEADSASNRDPSLLWSAAEAWERSGNRVRGAAALKRCASEAARLGQGTVACEVLERVQTLCEPHELPQIVETTLLIAQELAAYEIFERNLARYNTIRAGQGSSDEWHYADLAEIAVRRRLGTDIWRHHDKLFTWATSEVVPINHRRKAARLLLVAADESFQRDEFMKLRPELEELWRRADSLDSAEIAMIHDFLAGDMNAVEHSARHCMRFLDETDPLNQVNVLGNVSRAFACCGSLEAAVETAIKASHICERFDGYNDVPLAYARVADCLTMLGRFEEARSWQAKGEEIFRRISNAGVAYTLANGFCFAIQDRDLSAARDCLESLSRQEEVSKPSHMRTFVGFQLILAAAEGRPLSGPLTVSELLAMDDSGRAYCEHAPFAIGLYQRLVAAGLSDEASNRFHDYVAIHRRERYSLRPLLILFGADLHAVKSMLDIAV